MLGQVEGMQARIVVCCQLAVRKMRRQRPAGQARGLEGVDCRQQPRKSRGQIGRIAECRRAGQRGSGAATSCCMAPRHRK